MRIKRTYLVTGGLIAAVLCSPAVAQDVSAQGDTSATTAEQNDDVVVVKGIRKSLKTAVDRKRRSAQIVDSIDAEDAGKLPDNNVAEAISRVTGVQITRERGEGGSVAIRGMTDIQTSVNGKATNSGTGRSAGLNDVPAELLKSVQVYKTRTPDQEEGGIAGTVNVDLRRPLDLPKGWTAAGSVRNVYSNVGETESPYISGLIANRFDTAMGEMGFLLNLSFQKNNYGEQYIESETPREFWGNQLTSLPADQKGTVGVYKVRYGVERGYVERPSYNAAFQWRASDQLTFLLEASQFNAKEHRQLDVLEARLKDSNATLSDVVLMPDGKSLKSATFTGTDLPIGPWANDQAIDIVNRRINFETRWTNDRWDVDAGISLDENNFDMEWYRQTIRFSTATQFKIDMNSPNTIQGAPYVEYTGIDLDDVNNYYLHEFENGKSFEDSKESVWQFNASYRVSDDKLIRSVKFGAQHKDRQTGRAYGYRYATFAAPNRVKLVDFPTGQGYDEVSIKVPGFDSPTWYRLDLDSIIDNFDDIRAYAQARKTNTFTGSGGWTDEVVTTEDGFGSFRATEKKSAVYAQATYGIDFGNIPVDGVIGVRSTSTKGTSTTKQNPTAPELTDELDYSFLLPSATAVVHFTPKLQLRLAYTENVQSPNFGEATSWVSLDNGCRCGWGGNTDLRPNHEKSYDASLEYYFGRGGIVSFATYLKKPDGFITWTHEVNVPVGGYEGLWTIDRPTNAGPGEFQGYEFSAQGFFDFLPGKWKNFGASVNATYNEKATIKYPYLDDTGLGDYNAVGNSKSTYNLALYYDTPEFSARVAYNYRDSYRDSADLNYANGLYSLYVDPTSRLDVAVNWTPIKQLTLALEGTNLLENNTQRFWGEQHLIPMGMRVQARTIQLSARFRY
ncbi:MULTISPECIES: TonB-dependent receptor [Asticcacaulis]|uniref:TonB-dependent receptor n=1 Tax=Asticcacaulis TaxID=76890 RepID=UPI001AE5A88C|nr:MULTISPECIES: TonB-dependent receptor [Asticcacaulis]MBP2160997.1 TonB-dependent receptor [Asticcacaulis solisilvae]MDR6802042.1 TonB-dependent receptor [Asticcacaulis sp. BE141]